MNRLLKALGRVNDECPPIWFMRQAGRYHDHYQNLKKKHSFIELCKDPKLASEVTRGPIEDFDFDAAILFSDLLFPLEAMGMGLEYSPGPQLGWHLEHPDQLGQLRGGKELAQFMNFQGEALQEIRTWLSPAKGLIGFVGAPLTLYFYAAAGSHKGDLTPAHKGLEDGRFEGFVEKLMDLLAENMALQARAGADAIAVFDTCAGELTPEVYGQKAVPALSAVLDRFRASHPHTPLIYYSKKTGPQHWSHLESLPIQCLGIDWNHSLAETLKRFEGQFAIQGNIDPDWLFLQPAELEMKVRAVFDSVQALPHQTRRGWVCGLGHGVLPKTPTENVRRVIQLHREYFA